MANTLYCFRLGKCVPLLTDEEFESVQIHMRDRMPGIMKYRKEHGCSIDEARAKAPEGLRALDAYEQITGVRLEHQEHLYAVRMSDYGRPCPECAKPFRTPRAKFCAECGFQRPDGEVEGPVPDQS